MLNMVLAPYGKSEGYPSGIQYAIGGQGCHLCPPDPQYYRRGEAGFYHDTALGGLYGIPYGDVVAAATEIRRRRAAGATDQVLVQALLNAGYAGETLAAAIRFIATGVMPAGVDAAPAGEIEMDPEYVGRKPKAAFKLSPIAMIGAGAAVLGVAAYLLRGRIK
jgi:hypothetical protein